ncbi:MAG: DNA-binding protein [Streptosporangiales bacterium]|nr:DNA-binding protein [Streptosporangiales bacterium]
MGGTITDATATAIIETARRIAARGDCAARRARDPVNQPMVNNWVEALGDANPIYTDPEFAAASVHGGLVAPPAMVQVWTMHGLGGPDGGRGADDPLRAMMTVLDEAGYTSVVATDCEQTYHRYLRPGEHLTVTARLEDVAGPKRTALGEGWFVTTRSTWRVGEEPVAEMLFRVLQYRPAESAPGAPPGGDVIRPAVSRDTAFFWAGTAAGELRIQRCEECGRLRHPPGPMCPSCGAAAAHEPGYLVSTGRGEVYSYVVHHHPPVPGREPPFVVALVALDEGVRMLGELVDVAPEDVHIGLPVEVTFRWADDELGLPAWRPA